MELTTDTPLHVTPQVLCCLCGLMIDSNPSNMCPGCIRAHVDITEGLIKEYIVVHCPECGRYLQPPKFWLKAELESRELMTLCIKKVRGLNKYNLVDASFIWTEPHSKRLKLKMVLQKEIFANTVIQQTVVIEYVVLWQQCDRCAKVATNQPQWDACVQLRQKADHKRTFLFIEQLILKHRMQEDMIRIEQHPDGLDFFYGHRSHALKFVDFVNMNSPITRRDAKELVSHDSKSNTAVQHFTYSLEIAPICREDLICLPLKLHTTLGAIGPLVLVHKVFSSIVFIDPQSLRAGEITGTVYWKNQFLSLANSRQLVEFYIVDIELTGVENGKLKQAMATVCLSSEVGQGREWVISTHLGHLLQPGDLAKGYLLAAINYNNDEVDSYNKDTFPDAVLVHKHFPNQAARRHKRNWKLKRLDIVDTDRNRKNQEERQRDLVEFEDDIERDKEFRSDIPLYKDVTKIAAPAAPAAAAAQEEDDEAQVDITELLDELTINEDEPRETAAKPILGKRTRDTAE